MRVNARDTTAPSVRESRCPYSMHARLNARSYPPVRSVARTRGPQTRIIPCSSLGAVTHPRSRPRQSSAPRAHSSRIALPGPRAVLLTRTAFRPRPPPCAPGCPKPDLGPSPNATALTRRYALSPASTAHLRPSLLLLILVAPGALPVRTCDTTPSNRLCSNTPKKRLPRRSTASPPYKLTYPAVYTPSPARRTGAARRPHARCASPRYLAPSFVFVAPRASSCWYDRPAVTIQQHLLLRTRPVRSPVSSPNTKHEVVYTAPPPGKRSTSTRSVRPVYGVQRRAASGGSCTAEHVLAALADVPSTRRRRSSLASRRVFSRGRVLTVCRRLMLQSETLSVASGKQGQLDARPLALSRSRMSRLLLGGVCAQHPFPSLKYSARVRTLLCAVSRAPEDRKRARSLAVRWAMYLTYLRSTRLASHRPAPESVPLLGASVLRSTDSTAARRPAAVPARANSCRLSNRRRLVTACLHPSLSLSRNCYFPGLNTTSTIGYIGGRGVYAQRPFPYPRRICRYYYGGCALLPIARF